MLLRPPSTGFDGQMGGITEKLQKDRNKGRGESRDSLVSLALLSSPYLASFIYLTDK